MNDMALTNRQIFWMMVSMQIIMTILLTTSPAIRIAQQDAWISSVLSTGIGITIAFICGKLCAIFPGQTLIEYSRVLLGKWLGGFIAALYILFWILTLAVILKQFSLFITGTIMPKTPVPVIEILMLIIVLYPTLHGIGVIARICELTGPIILVGVVGPMFLGINEMEWDRLLPVYSDSGYMVIMKGALPAATFLGDCVMLLMLISFVAYRKHTVRHAVGGVMLSGMLALISVIVSIIMFGPNVAASYPYPMLMIVRSISIGGIIENLDAIVITVWIMSIFTKLALYLFVASYGTSQLLGMKDWRKTVWFIAVVAMIMALIPLNYEEISVIFPRKIAIPYLFPVFMAGGPLFLLILALIKRKKMAAPAP
ncbi:GerAB/ArcD/ProY family transporter [Paenibacillus sp. LMG 31456]|uniref:GerAB/ArcD/ProY family transporter n=1 Tax=Paenibacillus foliorum TaxID=2654974 RepID=A0A972GW63_9BACL|nr:endospore germination permease [Paenibacillus foliorum]NOU98029.1 GerAB/ArcD/ProY family transporter [Paenibacillus foliorum]